MPTTVVDLGTTHSAVCCAPRRFTGKERDTESGNDYFEARYLASSMGRFLSPDPSNLSVDWWLPQTWNRYTYGLNNPLTMVDKNGLWPSPVHSLINESSFPGMSKQDMQRLKDATWNMDWAPGQQDPRNSFQHGMSNGSDDVGGSPGLLQEEARQDADTFISQQVAAAQQQSQSSTSQTQTTSTSNDRIANALGALPGVTGVTPTGDPSFNQGGHKNETESLSFSSPDAEAKLLATSSRKGLLPKGVSENGFGPGVRLPGGLHVENGRIDSVTGNLIVTSHIDRFNANNGLAPLVGHFVVDVFIGTVFFHHSAGLDQ